MEYNRLDIFTRGEIWPSFNISLLLFSEQLSLTLLPDMRFIN